MTNIKETIKDLEDIKNCINQNMIAQRGFSLFVPRHKETLSQAIKICQAVESTGEELEKRKHEKGCKYWAREHSHDCDCGSEDFNDAIDIARPILAKRELFWQDNFIAQAKEYDKKLAQELAKAKLRIEELEKTTGENHW